VVKVSKWDVFRRSLLYILVGLAFAGLALQTYTTLLIRDTQVTNTAIGKNTNATSKQVKQLLHQFEDCINPKGDCAQRSAQRTGVIIQQLTASLQRVVILQGVCQHRVIDPSDPNQVSMCVAHLLNQEKP
jgi:hypothetical protein